MSGEWLTSSRRARHATASTRRARRWGAGSTRSGRSTGGEVGERQLERLFRDHVGARPKLFARVVRMQRALATLERSRSSQAARASQVGYSDEAHLVHDWNALAEVTPRQLLAERHVGFVRGSAPAAQ